MINQNNFYNVGRKLIQRIKRTLLNVMPREKRHQMIRVGVNLTLTPPSGLVLKIAETKEELEGCFSLLHDAYVNSGFMTTHPSGMRVTIYHALPTTTTLCAKYDGQVVGTISMVRESALGVPMQNVFDISSVRQKPGKIAEVSALAIHQKFRRSGGSILFPLMKFMHEYSTTFFDTRHLVIAVNPSHIDMYESLLFFKRLPQNTVSHYDFVNGAPAIGSTLDLKEAPEIFRKHYDTKPSRRNLYAYFFQIPLPNIQFPARRFFTTNDPVMTPELLDYFFNRRTSVFEALTVHKKRLLHLIYDLPAYQAVLPNLSQWAEIEPLRHHHRFTVRCPAEFSCYMVAGQSEDIQLEIVDVSSNGFMARSALAMPLNQWCDITIHLGREVVSHLRAMTLRENTYGDRGYYGFQLREADGAWNNFVAALSQSTTSRALDAVPGFLP